MTIDIHETWSLTEAFQHLQISRATLWRIIHQHNIEIFSDARDLRIKRVRRRDLEDIVARAYKHSQNRKAA